MTGDQRALGELMTNPAAAAQSRDMQCIGSAEFCASLDDDQRFAAWFEDLDADISELAARDDTRASRFAALGSGRAGLIDFLDPGGIRLPLRR